MRTITADLTIKEILEIAPQSAIIFKNANLDCTGCKADTERSLVAVFEQNNISEDGQQKLLKHLNDLDQIPENLPIPTEKDFTVQKITEGNKTYYRLAGMLLTENAYKNLHQLATAKGLRIRLETGGCSGFKYEFDYFDNPLDDEKIYTLSPKLSLYINDFTFQRSYDSVLDFSIGLHESGLKIHNPNQKRGCSCGTSFGF